MVGHIYHNPGTLQTVLKNNLKGLYPEDGGSVFKNVCIFLQVHTALQTTRLASTLFHIIILTRHFISIRHFSISIRQYEKWSLITRKDRRTP
jgi:hypothetical protein